MAIDRAHILNQVAAGDLSAEEAAQRLRGSTPASGAQPGDMPIDLGPLANRWLRIRVTDMDTDRQRVNVNLPLAWVAIGLKIGAHYVPQIAGVDLRQILTDIQAGASGRLIEVEDAEDGERVEIFVD